MTGQTVRLHGNSQRAYAKTLIDKAPIGAILNIREANRTTDQNAKLWAMLSDISRSKPEGRIHTPDTWKLLVMQACGYQVQFMIGLDGEPFPVGHSSSKLKVQQMADLITWIYQYGDEYNVKWTEPEEVKKNNP